MIADTDGNDVNDANEDSDHDGLSNLREYDAGSLPIVKDSDGDGIPDGFEVDVLSTSPVLKDSDNDGLDDYSEYKLGTNPNDPDSNNNGVPDGLETYSTTASNDTLGMSVSITGVGDMSKKTRNVQETSEYYTNNSALRSPLVNVEANGTFDYAIITMKYDPVNVTDPANLSLCYYNESLACSCPSTQR